MSASTPAPSKLQERNADGSEFRRTALSRRGEERSAGFAILSILLHCGVVGTLTFVVLRPENIEELLKEKRRERLLSAEKIEEISEHLEDANRAALRASASTLLSIKHEMDRIADDRNEALQAFSEGQLRDGPAQAMAALEKAIGAMATARRAMVDAQTLEQADFDGRRRGRTKDEEEQAAVDMAAAQKAISDQLRLAEVAMSTAETCLKWGGNAELSAMHEAVVEQQIALISLCVDAQKRHQHASHEIGRRIEDGKRAASLMKSAETEQRKAPAIAAKIAADEKVISEWVTQQKEAEAQLKAMREKAAQAKRAYQKADKSKKKDLEKAWRTLEGEAKSLGGKARGLKDKVSRLQKALRRAKADHGRILRKVKEHQARAAQAKRSMADRDKHIPMAVADWRKAREGVKESLNKTIAAENEVLSKLMALPAEKTHRAATVELMAKPEDPTDDAAMKALNLAQLYRLCGTLEGVIVDEYRSLRAVELAMLRAMPLSEALRNIDAPKPQRLEIPDEALNETPRTTAGLDEQKKAIKNALMEVAKMEEYCSSLLAALRADEEDVTELAMDDLEEFTREEFATERAAELETLAEAALAELKAELRNALAEAKKTAELAEDAAREMGEATREAERKAEKTARELKETKRKTEETKEKAKRTAKNLEKTKEEESLNVLAKEAKDAVEKLAQVAKEAKEEEREAAGAERKTKDKTARKETREAKEAARKLATAAEKAAKAAEAAVQRAAEAQAYAVMAGEASATEAKALVKSALEKAKTVARKTEHAAKKMNEASDEAKNKKESTEPEMDKTAKDSKKTAETADKAAKDLDGASQKSLEDMANEAGKTADAMKKVAKEAKEESRKADKAERDSKDATAKKKAKDAADAAKKAADAASDAASAANRAAEAASQAAAAEAETRAAAAQAAADARASVANALSQVQNTAQKAGEAAKEMNKAASTAQSNKEATTGELKKTAKESDSTAATASTSAKDLAKAGSGSGLDDLARQAQKTAYDMKQVAREARAEASKAKKAATDSKDSGAKGTAEEAARKASQTADAASAAAKAAQYAADSARIASESLGQGGTGPGEGGESDSPGQGGTGSGEGGDSDSPGQGGTGSGKGGNSDGKNGGGSGSKGSSNSGKSGGGGGGAGKGGGGLASGGWGKDRAGRGGGSRQRMLLKMAKAAAMEEAAKELIAKAADVSRLMRASTETLGGGGHSGGQLSDSRSSRLASFVNRSAAYPKIQELSRDMAYGRRITGKGGPGVRWLMIDSWYVVGPWPNPKRVNRERKFPPENKVDLDSTYVGLGGRQLEWQFVQATRNPRHPAFITPPLASEYAIYYFYTEIWSDEARDLWFVTGSDDKSKIWINDMLVWESAAEHKGWKISEGYRKVHLKKGPNRILYRLENGHGPTGMSLVFYTKPGF